MAALTSDILRWKYGDSGVVALRCHPLRRPRRNQRGWGNDVHSLPRQPVLL
ncbi:hypothetical protein KCP73_03100 [Salmonella enterica subsp. enterica]|nr:hypothetical protein KCP73_03100 [Salmonella enterica subsp. enterica]